MHNNYIRAIYLAVILLIQGANIIVIYRNIVTAVPDDSYVEKDATVEVTKEKRELRSIGISLS